MLSLEDNKKFFKKKYHNGFEEAESIVNHVFEKDDDKKRLIIDFFGIIAATGKKDNYVLNLLNDDYEKYLWISNWIKEICDNLINLGCNKILITTAFLSFWDRSEGRCYLNLIKFSDNIKVSDKIRRKTGFAKSFYATFFSSHLEKENISLYLITEDDMIQFLNDINDLSSINKDLRCNVLNTLTVLEKNNRSIKNRILKCINKILISIENEYIVIQEIIHKFMINYIQWHLDSIRYKDMSEFHYKMICLFKNIIYEHFKCADKKLN